MPALDTPAMSLDIQTSSLGAGEVAGADLAGLPDFTTDLYKDAYSRINAIRSR